MRFPNPFGRDADADDGAGGVEVGGGDGERAQLEKLREEVERLRTEVLQINEAVRFTAASQNPRQPNPFGVAARKAMDAASDAVASGVVAAAAAAAVVEGDAKPSAWEAVLARIDRELGGLSTSERALLREAWDGAADVWQQSRSDLIEFKAKLNEQNGDGESAQSAAEDIDELIELLNLPIDQSERIGSVDALSFASQLVSVVASASAGLPAQEPSAAATSRAAEPPPSEPDPERQLALVRVATSELVKHNEAAFRALRGEPPVESEDELLAAFGLSLATSALQTVLATLLTFWLLSSLFGGAVWLVDRYVVGGVDASAFGQLLDAAQKAPGN